MSFRAPPVTNLHGAGIPVTPFHGQPLKFYMGSGSLLSEPPPCESPNVLLNCMFKAVQSFQAPAPHLTNVVLLVVLGLGCPKPLRVHTLLLLGTTHTTSMLVKFRNK